MAIRKAQSEKRYALNFSEREASAKDAINEHVLIGRFKALVNQSKPIPKPLGEYIVALLAVRKRPAHRPAYAPGIFHTIAMGSEVERRVSLGMKYEAAISEIRDTMPDMRRMRSDQEPGINLFTLSIASVKAAHTLFRRIANIPARPRGRRKRQLSK